MQAESSLSHGFVLFWIMLKNLIMDLSFPDELPEFRPVKDMVNPSSNLNNLVSEPSISGLFCVLHLIQHVLKRNPLNQLRDNGNKKYFF